MTEFNPPDPKHPLMRCADGALAGEMFPTPPGDAVIDIPSITGPRAIRWFRYQSLRVSSHPNAPRELRSLGRSSAVTYATAESMAVALCGEARLGIERVCRGGPFDGAYRRAGGNDPDASMFEFPVLDASRPLDLGFARYEARGRELFHLAHRPRIESFASPAERDAAITAAVQRGYKPVPEETLPR